MSAMFTVDWAKIFTPTVPFPETIIRGICTYVALFLMLRLFRRQTGSVGAADLLVLILIADAAQNAMADDYHSVTDGLLLVGTIVACDYVIDLLTYRFPWVAKVVERDPLLVVEDGKFHDEHLRQELMSREDLMSQLRQKGIADVAQVRKSYIEGDGHISVITDGTNQSIQSPTTSSISG